MVQDSKVCKMRDPPQVSAYVKVQQRMALAVIRGHQPDKALLSFYASMEHLCSVARPLLNHFSLSAIITATAQLWTSAQAHSSSQAHANMAALALKPFHCSSILQLEPMLPDVDAQAVSNILWSSAKLGLNLLWALGLLNHAPPDGAASAILEWFTRLCELPGQEPNAQSLGNTLLACAVLRLKVKGHVSTALVDGLPRLDRAIGCEQNYCNAAWSLAVAGMLTFELFLALLKSLRPLPVSDPAHEVLLTQQLSQLYQ